MLKIDLLIERDLAPADESFIYATWLRGLRYGNSWFERIDETLYFENYRQVVRALLASCQVKIACLKETPDVIIGYSVSDGPRLHWVHVKENWRRMGIATDLLPKDFSCYSHLTKVGIEILKNHKTLIFNPFLTGGNS